jgi:hypothetical protein
VIIEAIEDLDAAAVGELPVGAVRLPELVGRSASNRMKEDFGRLRGSGVISSWRARMRQMVATEGAVPSSRRGWWAMVCGPQSWPASSRSRHKRTIAAWISGAAEREHDRRRRERGSRQS